MKRIIITLLVFHSLSSFGQSFESIFSKDTTKWHVFELIADYATTKAYYSYSDSIIDNKKYFNLYSETIDPETQIGKNGILCGLVYEDTVSGQYLFRKNTSDGVKEALFMDLSLEQGDTTEIISDFRFMEKELVIVDTVYFLNNLKVIELDKVVHDGLGNSYNLKYMEGIGSNYGFYMAEQLEEPNNQVLLCKFNQNELVHSTISNINGNCYYASVGNNPETENFNIKVYPNPARGFITIKLEDSFVEKRLEILNSQGQVILNKRLDSNFHKIDFPNQGFYLLRIYLENDIFIKKIVNNGY